MCHSLCSLQDPDASQPLMRIDRRPPSLIYDYSVSKYHSISTRPDIQWVNVSNFDITRLRADRGRCCNPHPRDSASRRTRPSRIIQWCTCIGVGLHNLARWRRDKRYLTLKLEQMIAHCEASRERVSCKGRLARSQYDCLDTDKTASSSAVVFDCRALFGETVQLSCFPVCLSAYGVRLKMLFGNVGLGCCTPR